MHSTTVAASALAFAASAMAQVAGFAVMSSPAKDEDVSAGSIFNIVWAANNHNGLVDVTLMAGATPETLQLGDKIATGVDVTQNQLSWTVDCSLGKDATYGIKIASQEDEDLFQYSFPFHIDNTNCGKQQYGKPGGESGGKEGGEEGGKEATPSSTSSSSSSSSSSSKKTTSSTTTKTTTVTTTSKATTTTTSKATATTTSKGTTTATTTATTKGGYGGDHHGPGGPYGGPKGPGYWSSDCETTTPAPPPPPPAATPTLITSVVPPPAAPPAPPAPSTPVPVAAPPPAATTPVVEAPPSVVPVSPASRNAVTSLAVIAGIAVAAFAL